MKDICLNCKFWKEHYHQDEPSGECRKTTPSRNDSGKGVWPITKDLDWCGEYEETFDSDR